MQNLIIQSTAPTITGNFEEVKAQMLEGIKQYNVIVTSETVKDGKAMSAELNKMKVLIKEVQKKNLETLTGPISEFKEQIKELIDIAEEARQKILDQVKVFEDEQRKMHLGKMTDYLAEQIEEQNLTEYFSGHLHCKDFVSITGLTAKGGLTKKSRDQIDFMVSKALNAQNEAQLETERKQREEDIRVEQRAKELAEEAKNNAKTDFNAQQIVEHQKQVQDASRANMELEKEIQQDTFNLVDDVVPEQCEPIPEMKVEDVNGKAEFIAEIHILIKAPVNMPLDLMAQSVFNQLESQGVTDIQNIVIKG